MFITFLICSSVSTCFKYEFLTLVRIYNRLLSICCWINFSRSHGVIFHLPSSLVVHVKCVANLLAWIWEISLLSSIICTALSLQIFSLCWIWHIKVSCCCFRHSMWPAIHACDRMQCAHIVVLLQFSALWPNSLQFRQIISISTIFYSVPILVALSTDHWSIFKWNMIVSDFSPGFR